MNNRNVGIEILRIICMYMVVMLHCLSFTGILWQNRTLSLSTSSVWLLEGLCFVAVNCYVLISSYFLINKKFNFKRLLKIYVQVYFYSLLILFLFAFVLNYNLSKSDILHAFVPVLYKNYWFVTIYIFLCIFSPFLNIFINSLNKRQYKTLILIILFSFSVWPFIFQNETNLQFGGAYSIVWFICLYFISGYLKLHFDIKNYSQKVYISGYFISVLIYFILFMFFLIFKNKYFSPDLFYSYNFIFVLFASVFLFLYFLNINIKNKIITKIILFVAPLTFGVYLIHENPLVRTKLWDFISKVFVGCSNKKILIYAILISLIIFAFCVLIDLIRSILFKPINKYIYNSKFLNKISLKVENRFY